LLMSCAPPLAPSLHLSSLLRRPPRSTLIPYTTLFRSLSVRNLLHAVIPGPGTMQQDRFSYLSSLCRTFCRHQPLHQTGRAPTPANRSSRYPCDRTTAIVLYFHHCPSTSQRNCFCSLKGRSLHMAGQRLRSSV